jgi:hypothetical protein
VPDGARGGTRPVASLGRWTRRDRQTQDQPHAVHRGERLPCLGVVLDRLAVARRRRADRGSPSLRSSRAARRSARRTPHRDGPRWRHRAGSRVLPIRATTCSALQGHQRPAARPGMGARSRSPAGSTPPMTVAAGRGRSSAKPTTARLAGALIRSWSHSERSARRVIRPVHVRLRTGAKPLGRNEAPTLPIGIRGATAGRGLHNDRDRMTGASGARRRDVQCARVVRNWIGSGFDVADDR